MANDTTLTIVGNLTGDPELRFTQSGNAVANFTVASTPRKYDSQANSWVDLEPIFMRCTAWGEFAKNISETLTKGMRVIVTGTLATSAWQDRDTGEKRSRLDLRVQEVGPSLRYAVAQVRKNQRDNQQQQSRPQNNWASQQQQQGSWSGQQQQNDPWDNSGENPPF